MALLIIGILLVVFAGMALHVIGAVIGLVIVLIIYFIKRRKNP